MSGGLWFNFHFHVIQPQVCFIYLHALFNLTFPLSPFVSFSYFFSLLLLEKNVILHSTILCPTLCGLHVFWCVQISVVVCGHRHNIGALSVAKVNITEWDESSLSLTAVHGQNVLLQSYCSFFMLQQLNIMNFWFCLIVDTNHWSKLLLKITGEPPGFSVFCFHSGL